MPGDHLIRVAVVMGAKGLKGEVKLKAFTEDISTLCALTEFVLEDGRALVRGVFSQVGKSTVVQFKGVETREQAEALKGRSLFVPRSALPKPAEDEFFYEDLKGLIARGMDGRPIGRVVNVADFGAGDLLEITMEDSEQTVFVPFVLDQVPEVNVEDGYVVIDPAAGLLDEEDRDSEDKDGLNGGAV